jgi:membrane associated rhomboid family serine protease
MIMLVRLLSINCFLRMMNTPITLFLTIITVIFSFQGFQNKRFFDKYAFNVDGILKYKEYYRMISSGFLHGSWFHLIFNLYTFFSFGESLESVVGSTNFLFIYLISLIGGNILALIIHRFEGEYTAIGASGAVCGIIFASIAIFPEMQIGMFLIPLSISSWMYGLLFVLITIYGIKSRSSNVGHEAHLGGALVGMLVAIGLYPEVLKENYLPIVLIVTPSLAFIFLLIRYPEYLFIEKFSFRQTDYKDIDAEFNERKAARQEEIDEILDKIQMKGIDSLTAREKEALERFSEK